MPRVAFTGLAAPGLAGDLRLLVALRDLLADSDTGLTGPPDVVQAIPHHENHLHVRIFRAHAPRERSGAPRGE